MPSLLSLTHELIESEPNAFFWADEAGYAGFLPEYGFPEVANAVAGARAEVLDRTLPVNSASTMRCGGPVGNLLPILNNDFSRTHFYHQVFRPDRLHHTIDAVVSDVPSGKGRVALVLAPSARRRNPNRFRRSSA
jgi:hypothetical protein